MKIYVFTSRELSTDEDGSNSTVVSAKIDSDGDTILTFIRQDGTEVESPYLTRSNLIALRALVTKALGLIP
jgi:hypothetical protein